MSQERTERALGRIEAALARIDTSIDRASGHPQGDDTQIAERHEQLRAAVARSLRQLDSLIEGQAT